jgi:tetratricopeptide (TPR) repeat protein
MLNSNPLSCACFFIILILNQLTVSGNEFLDRYEISCPSSNEPLTFEFQSQPWLAPDELRSIDEYESSISTIESQQGVYSFSLVPELVGLGHSYRQGEKHSEAAAAYQRALDILKINEGLYSPNQLPLLEILIEENSKIESWEKVSDHYGYLHWLYRRNYDENDVRLLSVLKRIRQWEIDSYNISTGKSLEAQFNTAKALHTQIIDILTTCTDDRKLAYCYLHNGCCPEASEDAYCPIDE